MGCLASGTDVQHRARRDRRRPGRPGRARRSPSRSAVLGRRSRLARESRVSACSAVDSRAPPPSAGPAAAAPHRVVIVGGGFGGLYAARELRKAARRRGRHARRPAQPPPVPAAALPGRDRRPVAGRDRAAAAVDLPPPAQHDRAAGRGDRHRPGSAARSSLSGRPQPPVRHADRRDRRPPQLLRARRVGAVRAGPQDDRRRDGDPAPDPDRVRGRRARGGPRPRARVDDLRARRRRADRAWSWPARWARSPTTRCGPTSGRSGRRTRGSMLIEALDRILPTYPPDRSASAAAPARAARGHGADGDARRRHRRRRACGSRTTLGHRGDPRPDRAVGGRRARVVVRATVAEADRAPRPTAPDGSAWDADLTIPGHPEILVVGDAAVQPWKRGRPCPGVAQGGIQGGKHAGRGPCCGGCAASRCSRSATSNRGDVAVIGRLRGRDQHPAGWGRSAARAGSSPGLLWLGIHIVYLIGFANRIVVIGPLGVVVPDPGPRTRLITGSPLVPPIEHPAVPGDDQPGVGAAPPAAGCRRRWGAAGAAAASPKSAVSGGRHRSRRGRRRNRQDAAGHPAPPRAAAGGCRGAGRAQPAARVPRWSRGGLERLSLGGARGGAGARRGAGGDGAVARRGDRPGPRRGPRCAWSRPSAALLEAEGWLTAAEVTYSGYGERGSIDLLAFHPATRTLLVVEVKTEIASVEETLRRHDAKVRLAPDRTGAVRVGRRR